MTTCINASSGLRFSGAASATNTTIDARLDGNGTSSQIIVEAGRKATLGTNALTDGFDFDGMISLADSSQLTIEDLDAADLGASTSLDNAVLNATNGLRIESGEVISGDGQVNGDFTNANTSGVGVQGSSTGGEELLFTGRLQSLYGSSMSGNVAVSGTFAPGSSPGVVTVENLDLTSALLEIDLDGLVAGSEYDQVIVTNSLTLDGTLAISLTFTPTLGASFKIFDVQGSGSVSGLLNGVADNGSLGMFGSTELFIDYNGGDGNDVLLTTSLTVVPEPSSYLTLASLLAISGLRSKRTYPRNNVKRADDLGRC